jgi:tetratricopeptide (TPR) repeat protein
LNSFLNYTGRLDEWLALSRDAEIKAAAAKDLMNAGWRAYCVGWVHYLRGQSAEVFACADRAETHWHEAQAGAREQGLIFQMRGIGHILTKDYLAAIAAHRESVKLHRNLSPERVDVDIDLNWLGEAERLSGNFNDAERDYREALQIARAVNDPERIAAYTGNLAGLSLNREDWLSAETLAREALLLAEKIRRVELIASNCRRLAEALTRQGRKPEALPYARRAVEIFTVLRHLSLEEARQTLALCEG